MKTFFYKTYLTSTPDRIVLNIRDRLPFTLLMFIFSAWFAYFTMSNLSDQDTSFSMKLFLIFSSLLCIYIFIRGLIINKTKGLYFESNRLIIKGLDFDGFTSKEYLFYRQDIKGIKYSRNKLTEIELKNNSPYSFMFFSIRCDNRIIDPVLKIWFKIQTIEEMESLLIKKGLKN